jgi:predicted AAA+ superfamily ATPase
METSILPRLAADPLQQALGVSPVVVLTGSRQTGKSTLVRMLPSLQDRPYWTLDDIQIRSQAKSDPNSLVSRAPSLTLDEVQREPDLILAIKRAIDERHPRKPGQFLLTGSANLLLMKRISETLAGRATYVTLWPLTRRERLGLGSAGIWSLLFDRPQADWYELVRTGKAIKEDWREVARLGGYPAPSHQLSTNDQRKIWLSGYVQTYLERDLQDLAAIENLVDFQRFMRIAALRTGNLLNQADIGRDAGIPRPTIHRYLNLLETSYQIVRLESYGVNRTKRLIKTPKLFWADTAMALFVAGLDEPTGAHFESMVLSDLIAWRDSQFSKPQILYWRTASDQEVDFVIEHNGKLLAVEVKSTSRPSHADTLHLQAFREEYGKQVAGALLLHTGDEVSWIGKGILATPWWRVL